MVFSQAWRPVINCVQASRCTFTQLYQQTRNIVAELGLRRRGCRAGNHVRRRLLTTQRVTSSVNAVESGFIPTIVGNRQLVDNSPSQHQRTSSHLCHRQSTLVQIATIRRTGHFLIFLMPMSVALSRR